MIFYTETNYYDHDKLMNSLSKGRDDYFEVLKRMGFRCIVIPTIRTQRFLSFAGRLRFERRLSAAWKKELNKLKRGDVLVIHNPNSEKFASYARLIRKAHIRGVKIVTIVFELETFLISDYAAGAEFKRKIARLTEKSLFRTSDAIVVHNDVMKERLVSAGFDGRKMFSVGVMDYLRDEPLSEKPNERISREKPVAFAGNLAYEKSQFEYALPAGFRCNLYGSDYTGPVNEDVCYKGVFDPIGLMEAMEGSFGLVWDGDSVDGCTGQWGDYLTFNNPHKIAVYLASGMPVIVWDKAAMSHFVRREECGLVVGSLREVPDLIEGLSDEDYERMRRNACRVGSDMRRGLHIQAAVEAAVKYASRKNALIIFTREPEPGRTKTRLMPRYTQEQCAELHECFLRDIASEARRADADIFVAYTGGEGSPGAALGGKLLNAVKSALPRRSEKQKPDNGTPVLRSIFPEVFKAGRAFEQKGDGLGERMENAISYLLGAKNGETEKTVGSEENSRQVYEKAVLIGTDIPELRAESIDAAFRQLDDNDIVLGPTADGGYYLIGMKEPHSEAFDVEIYGVGTVFEETAESIRRSGLTVGQADTYSDIDEPEDIEALRDRLSRTAVNDGRMRGGRPARVRRQAEPEEKVYRPAETAGFLSRTAGISVIIPVFNEEATAGSMIEQLTPFSEELEIIFVDGGSTDGTAAIVEEAVRKEGLRQKAGGRDAYMGETGERNSGFRPGFRLLRSAKGRGRQMNLGAENSCGDILFFLHCDSVLPGDFIEEIRSCMAAAPYGCFGLRFESRNLFMLTNRFISNHRAFRRGLPFGDQGIFMDRSLFFGMGMFPETEIMEDYEFSLRMRSRGYRPAMTRRRIEASARRYGKGSLSILNTELFMWKLRRLYRRGADTAGLAEKYRDIR